MKRVYLAVISLVIVLLAIGTFFDLHIDIAIHNPESLFGHLFAVVAMVPIWVLMPMTVGLMFGSIIEQFEKMTVIWKTSTVFLLVFGVFVEYKFMEGFVGSRHLHGMSYEMLVCMTIISFMASTVLGANASRKFPREVLMAAVVGVVAICFGRFLLDISKTYWGRYRFWAMDDPLTQFTQWYQPQFPSAERIKELGDEIKSFPSGHSLGAMSMLWLSMFPSFLAVCQSNAKKWSDVIAIIALCFWLCVMISRMILGEHFLSDVSMSALFFLLFFIWANAVVAKARFYK